MKEIKDFDGLYSVTETGEVWAHPKKVPVGKNGGLKHLPMKPLKLFKNRADKEHLRVYLSKNGVKHPKLVHRLVAEAFIPNPKGLPQINHKDGNPSNNCVENLEWCDAKQNAQHAIASGLTKLPDQSGSANSNAKLTETDVLAIRQAHERGKSCAAISRQVGVSYATVYDIIKRRRWAHL